MPGLKAQVGRFLEQFEKEFATLNRLEISSSRLLHNFDFLQKQHPQDQIWPVLKSNAYGHGLQEVVQILQARKPIYVCVDGYFEALQVREVCAQPVLVMGYIDPENYQYLDYNQQISFVVQDFAAIEALGKTGKKVKIHLEINTGMNRHGIKPEQILDFYSFIQSFPNLELEGVMSHLADADDMESDFSKEQEQIFKQALFKLKESGFEPPFVHLAQSAGSARVDLSDIKGQKAIRLGLGLYGFDPLEKIGSNNSPFASLQPILSLKSKICKILELEAGETVGYGRSFVAQKSSKIGVLPLGYYESLPRKLSNCGQVRLLKNGQLAPIVGRICMNHTMIDLTEQEVELLDEVEIFSHQKGDALNLAQICQKNDLFLYETLVHLNENLRRKIV